jgi:hypothetical protein
MPMNPRLLRPLDTGFNPRKLAGLDFWLDASDASTITVATGVSEWRDKSGRNKHFTQTTGNNQPATGSATMGGKNAILFDGTDDFLECATPMTDALPLTFFFVFRLVAKLSNSIYYAGGTAASNFHLRHNASGGSPMVVAGGGIAHTVSGDREGIDDILLYRVPATGDSLARRSGTAFINNNATLKPQNLGGTHRIARNVGGFTSYANIAVAEIISYNSLLSDTQVATVEKYLSKKWGVTLA